MVNIAHQQINAHSSINFEVCETLFNLQQDKLDSFRSFKKHFVGKIVTYFGIVRNKLLHDTPWKTFRKSAICFGQGENVGYVFRLLFEKKKPVPFEDKKP